MLSVLVQAEFLAKQNVKKFMIASKMLLTISQIFQRNKFQQTAINSANLEKIKIIKWNCRGLSNKKLELLVFLKGKDIDIVCLNEVKRWEKKI